MRVHPIAVEVLRVAKGDDVLPLSKPITGSSGKVYNELHIPAGTATYVSTVGYNMYVRLILISVGVAVFEPVLRFAGTRTFGGQTPMSSGQKDGSRYTKSPSRPLGSTVTCE